jgi:hypothetical protein
MPQWGKTSQPGASDARSAAPGTCPSTPAKPCKGIIPVRPSCCPAPLGLGNQRCGCFPEAALRCRWPQAGMYRPFGASPSSCEVTNHQEVWALFLAPTKSQRRKSAASRGRKPASPGWMCDGNAQAGDFPAVYSLRFLSDFRAFDSSFLMLSTTGSSSGIAPPSSLMVWRTLAPTSRWARLALSLPVILSRRSLSSA